MNKNQGVLFDEPEKKRTRSQIGMLSKRKGKVFEQSIVKLLRGADLEAERGYWQSIGGGRVPDVMLDGVWLELGHGKIDPLEKLEQAEAYVEEGVYRVVPVAVTKQRSARVILVTMRLWGLASMLKAEVDGRLATTTVSMTWEDFLHIYKIWKAPEPVKTGFQE